MFRTILVPLDGSARAERALPAAVALAKAGHGSITLVTATREPRPMGAAGAATTIDTRTADELSAAAYLDEVAARQELAGIETRTLVRPGSPAALVLDAIDDLHADLVVICRHGQTALTRWALGNVAEKVARHSAAPVLLLHESGPTLFGVSDHHTPGALIPLDGSSLAQEALNPAAQLVCALAQPGAAALHLSHVVTSAEEDIQYGDAATLDAAGGRALRDTFLRHADTLRQPGLEVSWSVLHQRDVARSIVETAEGHPPQGPQGPDFSHSERPRAWDVIALTTYGEGGAQRWSVGSVAGRVLHTTQLPMLIVRPSAQ